ncbi:MAG: hypothetical protein GF307_05935 [candidate division Zixibacteria bacterium]|nr:hypothetical protein [candidate division Zixibacteria bacterium]
MAEENKESTAVTIWDYFLVLLKWRKVIFFNVIAVGVVVGIISLIIPSWYYSATTVMPPTEESFGLGSAATSMLGGLGAFVGGGAGGGLSLPSFGSSSDIYAEILASRTVVERVTRENNLAEAFDYDRVDEELLKTVWDQTSVEVKPTGMIKIGFEAKDPVLAAQTANSYAAVLNSVNQQLKNIRASNTRRFIGERLDQNRKDLAEAEENLRAFKEKHNALDLTEQIKAQIGTIADLNSKLVMAEIEYGVLLESMSPNNAAARKVKSRIDQIDKQLNEMMEGSDNESRNIILPFSDTPQLGLEFVRLTREFEIQETIFELLITQFEQAKIEEQKDTPTLQVLDEAKPPERRSRPVRFKMVLMGMLGSLAFSVIVVLLIEYFSKLKERQSVVYDKFDSVVKLIHNDMRAISGTIFRRKKEQGTGT